MLLGLLGTAIEKRPHNTREELQLCTVSWQMCPDQVHRCLVLSGAENSRWSFGYKVLHLKGHPDHNVRYFSSNSFEQMS